MDPRLSALLVQDRAVSFGQMDEAVRRSRDSGMALADALLELGFVDETRLLEVLGRLHGEMMPLPLDVLQACDEEAVAALAPQGEATVPTMIAVQSTEDGILVATTGQIDVSDMQVARDRLQGAPFLRLVVPFRLAQIAAALYGTPIPESQRGLARRYPLDVRLKQLAPAPGTDVAAPAVQRESDGPWRPGELDEAFAAGLTRDEIIENTLSLLEQLGPRRAVLAPSGVRLRAARCAGFEHEQPLSVFSGEFHPAPWVQAGLQTDAAVRASIAELGLTDWYGFVDGDFPLDILLAPVTLRGRMILLLLVDSGSDDPLSAERTPWLSVAAHRMARALGVLIANAKAGGERRTSVSTESATVSEQRSAPEPASEPPNEPAPTVAEEPEGSAELPAEIDISFDDSAISLSPASTDEAPEVASDVVAEEPGADPAEATDARWMEDADTPPPLKPAVEEEPAQFPGHGTNEAQPDVSEPGSSMFDILEVMPIASEASDVDGDSEPQASEGDAIVDSSPPAPGVDASPEDSAIHVDAALDSEPGTDESLSTQADAVENAHEESAPVDGADESVSAEPPPLSEEVAPADPSSAGVHFATTKEKIEIPREFIDSKPSVPLDGWDEPSLDAPPKRRIDQSALYAELDAAAQSRNTTELPVVVDETAGLPAGVEIARQLAMQAGAFDDAPASSPRTAALHPVTDSVTAVGSPSAPLSGPPASAEDVAFLGDFEVDFGSDSSSAGEVEFSITDFPAMEMPRPSAVTDSVSVAADFVHEGRRARTARLHARDAGAPGPTKEVPTVDPSPKPAESFDARVSTVPRIEYLGDFADGFTPEDARPVRVSQPSRPHAVALDIEASGALLDKTRTLLPSGEPGYRGQAEKLSPEQLLQWLTSDVTRQREAAFATLLDRGESAHPLLLNWFPRPLNGDRREMVTAGQLLEDHGPVVWLCALQAQAIAPGLRRFLQNPQSDCRYYALQVLHRVNDEPSVRDVAVLLFDPDEQIRRSARVFLDTFRTQPSFQAVLQIVRRGLSHTDVRIQRLALDYAADFADAGSVHGVVGLLESSDAELSDRAEQVLRFLTFQPFGKDMRAWERWQRQTMGTRRERWLLDAMVDKDRRVRESAAAMIDAIPRLIVNYTAEMDRQGQLAAQRKVEHFLRDRPGLV